MYINRKMLFSSSGSFFSGLPQPVVTRKKQVRDKVFKYPFRLLVAKKRAEKGKTKAVMPSKMLNEVAESIVPDWASVLRNVPQAARLLDVNESRKDKAEIFNTFILPNRNVSDAAKKFLKKMVNEFTFSDNLEPIDVKTDRQLERYRLMSGGHDLESDLRDGRIVRDRSEPLESIMTRIFSPDRLDQAARSGHSSSDLAELVRKVYNTSDDQEKAIDEFLRKKMRDRADERQAAEARQGAATAARQEQDRRNQELASLRSANSVFSQAPLVTRPADDQMSEELEAFNAEEAEAWAQQQRQAEQAAEEVGPPPEQDQMSQQAIIPGALPVASADALIPTEAPATTSAPPVMQEVTEPSVIAPAVVESVEPEPVFDEQQVMSIPDENEGANSGQVESIDLPESETDAVAPLADNPAIVQTQEGAANVTGAAQDTNAAVLAAPPQIANSDIPIAEVKPDVDVVESQIAGLPVQNPVREEALGVEDQPTGPQAAAAGQSADTSADETREALMRVRDRVEQARGEAAGAAGRPPAEGEIDKEFLRPQDIDAGDDGAIKYLLRYNAPTTIKDSNVTSKQMQGENTADRDRAISRLIEQEKITPETGEMLKGKTGREIKIARLLESEPDPVKRQQLKEYHQSKVRAYRPYVGMATDIVKSIPTPKPAGKKAAKKKK